MENPDFSRGADKWGSSSRGPREDAFNAWCVCRQKESNKELDKARERGYLHRLKAWT